MRRILIGVLALLGCNGLFEGNPEFVEGTSGAQDSGGGSTVAPTDSGQDTQAADDTTVGAASGEGSSSTAVPTSSESGSTGGQCEPDEYEFNDEQMAAANLDQVMTSMGLDVDAVLEGTGAVDWYFFRAIQSDGLVGTVKGVVDDEDGLRVCLYLKCDDNSDPVVACGAAEPSTSTGGLPGCCDIDTVQPDHACNGMPGGDLRVWMRVSDALDRNACLPHRLRYSFNGN